MAFIYKDDGARAEIHHNTKGAINEHIATAWLLKEGYDVFRNVSPRGRADLIARKWEDADWTPVDVKSEQFDLDAFSPMAEGQREQAFKYEGSGIRYLIVSDNGTCWWYDDYKRDTVAENDNFWIDPKTGQRFLHPRNDMSKNEWSFFCGWIIKHHNDKLTEAQIDFINGLPRTDRSRGRYGRALTDREKELLRKVHRFIYKKILGEDATEDESDSLVA